jgi:hypothetical protein
VHCGQHGFKKWDKAASTSLASSFFTFTAMPAVKKHCDIPP